MKVLRSLADAPRAKQGRSIALGTFDGVHVGHRRVIQAAVARAQAQQAEVGASVVTFEPHPGQVLHPDDPPKLLCSFDVKVERVAAAGAGELIAIPFTEEFSQMSAYDFCDQVLAGTLGARFVSVGANFRFGRGAEGDIDTLRNRGEFETEAVELVEVDGEPVSSSRIRALVGAGDVTAAAELLGDWFTFEGEVVHGDQRGRELQMPTANMIPDPQMTVPGKGVYAACARVGGREFGAAINVGVRPTFEGDGKLVVEAHLIGFDEDLYGETLRLAFLQRLRDERRFDSADELVARMRKDVAEAERVTRTAQGVGAR